MEPVGQDIHDFLLSLLSSTGGAALLAHSLLSGLTKRVVLLPPLPPPRLLLQSPSELHSTSFSRFELKGKDFISSW